MKPSIPLLLVLGTPACAGDDAEPMAADEGTTTVEAGDSTTDPEPAATTSGDAGDETTGGGMVDGGTETDGVDVDALYDCVEPDLAVVPMFGPGFDPRTGEFVGPVQDRYLVHTTQILVDPDAVEQFDALSGAIVGQLMETPGLLGVSFASEPSCGFMRTLAVWEDQASMFTFVATGAHAEAMARTTEVSITGRTTHWEAEHDAMPPTWEVALERIDDVPPSAVYD